MDFKSISIEHLNNLVKRLPDLESSKNNILKAAESIISCHKSGGKILLCGNGGSAADCEHIVAELVKSFILPRKIPQGDIDKLKRSCRSDYERIASKLQQGIIAISLTANTPLTTAFANDSDPDMVFAQKTYVLARPGDIMLAISTSGNSKNVVLALEVAKAFGIQTIGFTGSKKCSMDNMCNIIIKAPAVDTYRIQEYHLPIYHCICMIVEEELWG